MRKTKIVCTLGPSTDKPGVLKQVMEAGMNVARFNFSHGTHEEHLERLKKVRAVRTELGLYVATMLDTKGPEIRVKKFKNGSIELNAGDKFTLADTVFTVLQTHEDSIGARGDEVIGSFNDMSTVLSVEFDGKKTLILGDIDGRAEDLLLSHYSEKTLKADAVQVAHHLFNYLDRLYDVIEAEYAMVPQRSETKVNHDSQKYQVVARTVKDTNFRFANDGTDGFEVDTDRNEIVWTLHQEPIGGVYDGSEL